MIIITLVIRYEFFHSLISIELQYNKFCDLCRVYHILIQKSFNIYCIFCNRYLVLHKNNGKHQQYNFDYSRNVKAAENMQKNHTHYYIVDIVNLEKAINLKKIFINLTRVQQQIAFLLKYLVIVYHHVLTGKKHTRPKK